MSNDSENIPPAGRKVPNDQDLLNYLNNQLSSSDAHSVEKYLGQDAFTNDAMEGLQHISSKKNMEVYVDQLNTNLRHQLNKSRKRKDKTALKDQVFTYTGILLILILLIVSMIVLRKYLNANRSTSTLPGIPTLYTSFTAPTTASVCIKRKG